MMTLKERVIAALRHIERDRVPPGENGVDGRLVEQIRSLSGQFFADAKNTTQLVG
jgi:hypothetical protein